MTTQKWNIVVGGGLAGLFSALTMKKKGYENIVVVERDTSFGGLLKDKTYENPLGDGRSFTFDFGTHFILEPEDQNIRNTISEQITDDEYYKFTGSLQEAHILNGQLYEKSGCANIFAFPHDVQERISEELEDRHKRQKSNDNLNRFYDHCVLRYGPTATKKIYGPAYKKFTGVDIKSLDISMGDFFAPGRIIAHDRKTSLEKKENKDWDWRLAYADCNDGSSSIIKYYPKERGIGTWLKKVAQYLESEGVQMQKNTTVDQIETNEEKVKRVVLSNGESYECERLLWTLPAIFLGKMADINVPSRKPNMRHVMLCHFITDKRPVERPYWVTIYDEKILSYRATLYDNFAPRENDVFRITVEILHSGELKSGEELEEKIFEEMISCKILPDNASALWSDSLNKQEGFPILSCEDIDVYKQQISILENRFNNIKIVGRRPDTGGGQLSVMNHIWEIL